VTAIRPHILVEETASVSPNLVSLMLTSIAIALVMAGVALWVGWGLLGAFLVYSLGGSMTLALLCAISVWRMRAIETDPAE
jgi:membrane protein implicated in regulation of membrane protease activity